MVWQNITSTTRVKGCPFGGLRKRTSGLCASATGRVPKFFCLSASRPAWISRGSAWSWGAIIWRRWVPLFCCPGIFSDERCDHRQRPMAVPLPALDRWLRCRSGRCAAVSLRPMAAGLGRLGGGLVAAYPHGQPGLCRLLAEPGAPVQAARLGAGAAGGGQCLVGAAVHALGAVVWPDCESVRRAASACRGPVCRYSGLAGVALAGTPAGCLAVRFTTPGRYHALTQRLAILQLVDRLLGQVDPVAVYLGLAHRGA